MGLFRHFRRAGFSHGIHPPDHKGSTAALPIRRLPFAPRLIVPLQQHAGRPAIPLVRPGQEVVRGQPIARADGMMSVPVHAPASGVIEGITLMPTAKGPKTESLLLKVYAGDEQRVRYGRPRDVSALSTRDLIQAVQDTGMVGLGGAGFPTHAKLSVPAGKTVDTLVVNGAECEPYLTADHRIMLEYTRELIAGTRVVMRAVGAGRAVIGVEDNKPDAAAAIQAQLAVDRYAGGDTPIDVQRVESKYPQGSEKMMIKALLGREVPSGGYPHDIGVLVQNVSTLAQLGRLLPRGEGLIERVVTVAGPGVARPGNYLVPLGTPLRFVLEQVGARGGPEQLIFGGPMMGDSVASLDAPVTKPVSGILVFEHAAAAPDIVTGAAGTPCIRCGRCVAACPLHLNPSELGLLAAKREYETMAQRFHLYDCMECGSCSYVCPSGIPLVQYFRIAKSIMRDRAA